jgi:hypothetical protein
MSVITQAETTITAGNAYATISYVPQGAFVAIEIDGITGSTVTLEAQWNGEGPFYVQKSWTSDPIEAQSFDAPRACTLRIGIAAGAFGSGSTAVKIGFDYPVMNRAR